MTNANRPALAEETIKIAAEHFSKHLILLREEDRPAFVTAFSNVVREVWPYPNLNQGEELLIHCRASLIDFRSWVVDRILPEFIKLKPGAQFQDLYCCAMYIRSTTRGGIEVRTTTPLGDAKRGKLIYRQLPPAAANRQGKPHRKQVSASIAQAGVRTIRAR